jgi:hypothetical protein
MKNTDWFPADLRPIHPGVYEVEGDIAPFSAEWVVGEGWRGTDGKWLIRQSRRWRGLTQEEKQCP